MKDYARFFKAVCDPSRQLIMKTLRRKGKLKVGDIASSTKLAQPTVSQHLKVLHNAGVVKSEKRGQQVYYSLCSDLIYDMITAFMKHYGPPSRPRKPSAG